MRKRIRDPSVSAYRVLPAQRVLPAARVVSTSRVMSRKPVLGVYTTAEAGETLIPHLYDLFFDGTDDYIHVTNPINFTDGATLAARFNVFSLSTSFRRILNGMAQSPCTAEIDMSIGTRANLRASFSNIECSLVYVSVPDDTVWIGMFHTSVARAVANSHVSIWVDGVLRTSSFIGSLIGVRSLFIGRAWWTVDPIRNFIGFISYAVVWSRALTDEEVVDLYSRYTVQAPLLVFLDPTFFDGSKYLDLSGNSNHGYPYGGVARVPAHRTWMYRVRGLYSGDRVRVLVPPMCRYRVGRGEWQVNDTWSTLELFLDPGWVSLVFEGL